MAITETTLFRPQLELSKLVQAYLEDKLKYFHIYKNIIYLAIYIMLKNAYKDFKKATQLVYILNRKQKRFI